MSPFASLDLTSEQFFDGALTRIEHLMLLLGASFTVISFALWGWKVALGFAVGAAIAYLNFFWLKRMVTAVADRVTQSGHSESGTGVITRFLLRYTLMGLGACAILSVSPASLKGLFAGIFLPVAAIACEAAYQAYAALAKGV
jgi:ATP synthase I subunit